MVMVFLGMKRRRVREKKDDKGNDERSKRYTKD